MRMCMPVRVVLVSDAAAVCGGVVVVGAVDVRVVNLVDVVFFLFHFFWR